MRAYVELLRPLNCVMIAVAVLIAGFMAIGFQIQGFLLVEPLAMLCAFFFAGAGNALNDYYDAETDKVNHPERPIPSGRVKRPAARSISIVLFAMSNIIAFAVSWYTWDLLPFLIVALATVLMVSYETWSKARGFVGNLAISLLIAMGFAFGGAVVHNVARVLVPALLAALSNVGREVLKDIEDMKGDKDRKTLPMTIGARKASTVAAAFFAIAIALSPLPYLLQMWSIYYLYTVLVADIIFIYVIYTSFGSPSNAQKASKAGMAVALAAFVAGGASI
jgi:geranylgeranylglycerol-phosphate geranylgeranyltransferase